jgi:hypothetical protein
MFDYYVDALIKNQNNSEIINQIIMEASKEGTINMEIAIRAFAFELYQVNQKVALANMEKLMTIKCKGIELEREIFEVYLMKNRYSNF